MSNDKVLYEKDGQIATITLNNPEKMNAWDFPNQDGQYDAFYSKLDLAEEDDEVKVVIIKGEGRAFSAGHDLNTVGFIYGMGTGQAGERRASQRHRLKIDRKWMGVDQKRLFLFPKVTIAQIHGYCVGEGLIVAECCDLAISTKDAKIGHVDQHMGLGGAGIPTLPILWASVGLKRGMEMLLTGDMMSGEQAAEIGLVNKAVDPEELEDEVLTLARKICLQPYDGIAMGKAARTLLFENMGLVFGFESGALAHTAFTNIRWEEGEHNFLRDRREHGTRSAISTREERFEKYPGSEKLWPRNR